MADVAFEDPQGFGRVGNLEVATALLDRTIKRTSKMPAILERIRNSQFPDDLLKHLSETVDLKLKDLEEHALMILEEPELWEFAYLVEFAHIYWTKRFNWHLAKRDHRRAWNELRNAFRGFNPQRPDPGKPMLRGNTSKLAAPDRTITEFVQKLYRAMRHEELVEAIESPMISIDVMAPGCRLDMLPKDAPRAEQKKRLVPEASLIGLFAERGVIFYHGQQAFVLARYFKGKEKERQNRRNERRVDELRRM